mgnify:CR=1 FL=1
MTWSEQFKAYIDTRFGKGSQQETAFALRISPSRVSYWCRGAVPRKQMRRRIERWSKGAVPAAAADSTSSRELPTGIES